MATNPLIAQGQLNRVAASLSFSKNPALNITAPYLGKEGISTSFEGEQTLVIPTNTGTVMSPEPYQMITVTAHILRSQPLSATYMAFIQQSTLCGPFTITSDSGAFPQIQVYNGAIKTTAAMLMNGTQADFTLELTGYWLINNSLWQ